MDITTHIKNINASGSIAIDSLHGIDRLKLLKFSDEVVSAYGKVFMENRAFIVDELLLPFTREEIRACLKMQFNMFAYKKDTGSMENLVRAYIGLSRFQKIMPEDQVLLKELDIAAVPKSEMFEKSMGAELSESEQMFLERFAVFNSYLEKVDLEKERLRSDFERFVKGFQALTTSHP